MSRWTQPLRDLFAVRSRQVLVMAAIVGAFTGLLVAAFDTVVVEWMLEPLLDLPLWAIAVMPTAGLALAALALTRIGPPASPGTADAYLQAFHDPAAELPRQPFVPRVLAAVATLGSGGAMGLEGPSLYMGASIGAELQRRARSRLAGIDPRTLMVAGAAAGVAAIFKAPATGTVFALEVPYQADFARRMLLPALVAAACGYLTFVAFHGTEPIIPARGNPGLTAVDLAGGVALGIAGGLVARAFATAIRWAKDRTRRHDVRLRVVMAGVTLAILAVVGDALADRPVTVGVGYGTLEWALRPDRAAWLVLLVLLLRCLATTATVAGGGVGGLFIPLVVAGALLGRAADSIVPQFDDGLAVVVGVAAVLGAGYRVPLAAVVFVAEATGRPGYVVPALLAAVAADLTMGRSSVTEYQQAAT
jgi:CIC family chloride channel protein